MQAYHARSQASSVLLAGAPGLGKTTFLRDFAKLVGMETIIIEIPHVTEEHMINIPFIVFDPSKNSSEPGRMVLTDKENKANSEIPHEYKLILAQSRLFTELVNSKPLSDDEYIKELMKAPKGVQELYVKLGGTQENIPALIHDVRTKFHNILFLDEFFRSTSTRIRNILRGILNHEIGMHRIPSTSYIVYASNMFDTESSVEDIPTNYEFQQIDFKAPSSKDWFSWLEHRCEHDYRVSLNPQLMQKFKKLLTDEDISYENTDVRTSPRRWEQILLYINSSLPVKNRQEALGLLTNIKNQFYNYLGETPDEEYSNLSEKVTKAVAELIESTSGVAINEKEILPRSDWRYQLSHLVDQQLKLGKLRKHIPVISGPPGVGKAQPLTSKIKTLNGWINMGDIKIGDIISTPDGTTASIIGVYPQGKKQIYKITCSDGRTTRACGEHLWKIRKNREDNWRIVSTHEMARIIHDTKQWIYIPLITPKDTDISNVPIDPYTLGCLLGDNCLNTPSLVLSTNDNEMLETLQNKLSHKIIRHDRFFNSYKKTLNKLNCSDKKSYTKFIPDLYKNGSLQQKKQLIAGLIDTDGYVNPQGALSISTSSNQLALDVQELVWSIGGQANINPQIIPYKNEKKLEKLTYHVIIQLPVNLECGLRVTTIEPDGIEEAQCIMVDHPEHLYITDNYVVTHNTSFAHDVALEHNLRLITIDCSKLAPDDLIGLPIPGSRIESDMKVQFTVPSLYKEIIDKIKEKNDEYKQHLKRENPDNWEQSYREFQNQKYKYLIFFDELNRPGDERTFNALRRVILERDFGPADQDEMVLDLLQKI